MNRRGNEYDVSARVNTTDSAIVNSEVNQIFLQLYPRASTAQIDQAFGDLSALYRGERPGYHACDTAYHDVQHVLDVTLAMARLIDGYERGRIGAESFDASMFRLGVITARRALSEGLPAQDRHGRGGRHRRGADPLHRLRDPGLRNQGALARLQAPRQPARLGGHHCADVRQVLPRKVPRPALSGISRRRHHPQAPPGREGRGPL